MTTKSRDTQGLSSPNRFAYRWSIDTFTGHSACHPPSRRLRMARDSSPCSYQGRGARRRLVQVWSAGAGRRDKSRALVDPELRP